MPYTITSDEYVEINSVPLHTPAWCVGNLWVLWSGPETRGSDRLIPGAAGVRPYKRRATVTRRLLELSIFGDRDWNDVQYDGYREGLRANIQHLKTNVTNPFTTGDGTRTAVLHLPDGSTATGSIHVVGFELGPLGPAGALATMEISIPLGGLA